MNGKQKNRYLHSEEGDTCEEIHCGLEVLQPFRTAGREVILQSKHTNWATTHDFTSVFVQRVCGQEPTRSNHSHWASAFCVGVLCFLAVCMFQRKYHSYQHTASCFQFAHTKTHRGGNRQIIFITGSTVTVIAVLPDTWTGLSSESCAADPKA